MDNIIANKCLKCGHYTISNRDGIRCAKCGGQVAPMGNATIRNRSADNNKGLTVNIELTGYENIKKQLNDIEAQIDRIIKKQNIINDLVKS